MGEDDACTVSTEIPVNFKAEKNGTYTLTISSPLTFKSLHLVDNKTGEDVDLLVTPQYTFEANTNDYASRFKLVFMTQQEEDGHDDFAFVSNGELIINGEGLLQIFDALGHQLLAKELSTFHFPLSTFPSPGVYVLHLTTGNKTRTQKIVIE